MERGIVMQMRWVRSLRAFVFNDSLLDFFGFHSTKDSNTLSVIDGDGIDDLQRWKPTSDCMEVESNIGCLRSIGTNCFPGGVESSRLGTDLRTLPQLLARTSLDRNNSEEPNEHGLTGDVAATGRIASNRTTRTKDSECGTSTKNSCQRQELRLTP